MFLFSTFYLFYGVCYFVGGVERGKCFIVSRVLSNCFADDVLLLLKLLAGLLAFFLNNLLLAYNINRLPHCMALHYYYYCIALEAFKAKQGQAGRQAGSSIKQ
jgi:hypothetical protein